MKKRKIWTDYFTFSKKERLGILAVAIIVFISGMLPFINLPPRSPIAAVHDSAYNAAINIINDNSSSSSRDAKYDNDLNSLVFEKTTTQNYQGQLFRFDPNTLNAAGFKQLGLRDRTIQILINYRNKGGHFKKAEDLQKIYGLRPEEFNRLQPYIFINAGNFSYNQSLENYPKYDRHEKPAANNLATEERKHYTPKTININIADSNEFKSLYGIGSKLAARIINFRDKLGGFYSIQQVGETYGVPDSTFQRIKAYLQVSVANIKKLNINSATYQELNNHPYISGKLAYLIIKKRKEIGPILNMNDIKNIITETTDDYEKVSNYLVGD